MSAIDRLDEMQARVDAATEGPWSATWGRLERARVWASDDDAEALAILVGFQILEDGKPDAEFIAHARQDVPALLAALRAVLAECAEAQRHPGSVRAYMADDIRDAITSALEVTP